MHTIAFHNMDTHREIKMTAQILFFSFEREES